MELCSFWVINPAEGQDCVPEPVKLVFYENGDLDVISISEDPDSRGAFRLPCGGYSYTGDALNVSGDKLGRIGRLVKVSEDDSKFRASLFEAGVLNDQEWSLFYANPRAWKNLRIVAITFGD